MFRHPARLVTARTATPGRIVTAGRGLTDQEPGLR